MLCDKYLHVYSRRLRDLFSDIAFGKSKQNLKIRKFSSEKIFDLFKIERIMLVNWFKFLSDLSLAIMLLGPSS